jgi:hypothetical protein
MKQQRKTGSGGDIVDHGDNLYVVHALDGMLFMTIRNLPSVGFNRVFYATNC